MSIEERLRSGLQEGLAGLDVGPGDVSAAAASGARVRRRRRVVILGATTALVAVVAVGVAVPVLRGGSDGRDVEPAPAPSGTWTDLAPAPISGRWSAVGTWTGKEAVFVGGGTSRPCPPNANCVTAEAIARDGAAYDPATDTWRRVADAPVPIGYWYRSEAVGDDVVYYGDDGQGERHWLAYDTVADAWSELPPAPRRVQDWGAIPARDGRVYAISAAGVMVLDVASETWSELPPSLAKPRFDPASVLPTDDGVFVSGALARVGTGDDDPAFTVVERWDGSRWTRLPVTGQVGAFQQYADGYLLDTDPQTADGLTGQPPEGGRLDVATGEWSPIPGNPSLDDPRPDGWTLDAAGDDHVVSWGYDYDARAGTFTPFGRPDSDVDSQQSAVWADGELIAFGGIDEDVAWGDGSGTGLSHDAWSWTP